MATPTTTAPTLELRKFAFYPRLSEETNAYNAIIRVDGIDCIAASNKGNGGSDDYNPYSYTTTGKDRFNVGMKKIADYAASLPPKTIGEAGHEFTMQPDTESLIGELVQEAINAKEDAKHRRKCERDWPLCLYFASPEGLVSVSLTQPREKLTAAQIEATNKQIMAKSKQPLTPITAATFDAAWPALTAALRCKPLPATEDANTAPLPTAAAAKPVKSG